LRLKKQGNAMHEEQIEDMFLKWNLFLDLPCNFEKVSESTRKFMTSLEKTFDSTRELSGNQEECLMKIYRQHVGKTCDDEEL
jgi:hypothetical protein